MKAHCKDSAQEQLEECLLWLFGSPLPSIPLHAGIESAESQIQAK